MKYELSSQGLAQLRKPVSALGKCVPRLNRYGEKETHTGEFVYVRYTAVRAAD